jgi:tricorn protease-like protein
MSYDTSNPKPMKQLPISVCYFQEYDSENPAKNKVLTFVEISGETHYIMSMQMMKAIANYDLETKVVELSADNTSTNFRSLLIKRKKETC